MEVATFALPQGFIMKGSESLEYTRKITNAGYCMISHCHPGQFSEIFYYTIRFIWEAPWGCRAVTQGKKIKSPFTRGSLVWAQACWGVSETPSHKDLRIVPSACFHSSLVKCCSWDVNLPFLLACAKHGLKPCGKKTQGLEIEVSDVCQNGPQHMWPWVYAHFRTHR